MGSARSQARAPHVRQLCSRARQNCGLVLDHCRRLPSSSKTSRNDLEHKVLDCTTMGSARSQARAPHVRELCSRARQNCGLVLDHCRRLPSSSKTSRNDLEHKVFDCTTMGSARSQARAPHVRQLCSRARRTCGLVLDHCRRLPSSSKTSRNDLEHEGVRLHYHGVGAKSSASPTRPTAVQSCSRDMRARTRSLPQTPEQQQDFPQRPRT